MAELDWPAFRLGYLTALDDIERTGLQPAREDTKESAAARAYDRRFNPPPSNREEPHV